MEQKTKVVVAIIVVVIVSVVALGIVIIGNKNKNTQKQAQNTAVVPISAPVVPDGLKPQLEPIPQVEELVVKVKGTVFEITDTMGKIKIGDVDNTLPLAATFKKNPAVQMNSEVMLSINRSNAQIEAIEPLTK